MPKIRLTVINQNRSHVTVSVAMCLNGDTFATNGQLKLTPAEWAIFQRQLCPSAHSWRCPRNNHAGNGVCLMSINWNDRDFYTRIVEQVEEIGLSRMKSQPKMDEADFFAGAMAALTALGMEPVQYPAGWTLGILFGRPPLARRLQREAEQHQEPTHEQVA